MTKGADIIAGIILVALAIAIIVYLLPVSYTHLTLPTICSV